MSTTIDTFIQNTYVRGALLNYRKRDQVSKLRKTFDDFERTKRMFNTNKRVSDEDITRLSSSLMYMHQQVKQMHLEFELLSSAAAGKNIAKIIVHKNIEQLVSEYKATLSAYEIKVPVGPISIRHNGEDIKIGNFDIYISNTPKIRIIGDNPKDGFGHPHVYDRGDSCFGTFKPIINRLLYSGQWVKLYHVLIEFLNIYNHDSPYKDIQAWKTGYKECGCTLDCECEWCDNCECWMCECCPDCGFSNCECEDSW